MPAQPARLPVLSALHGLRKRVRRLGIHDPQVRRFQRDIDALHLPKLRKQEAITTARLRAARRFDALHRGVRRVLRSSAPGLPSALRTRIADGIVTVAKAPDEFDATNRALLDALDAADPTSVSPGTWLALRLVLVRHGFLTAWEAARRHAHVSAAHFGGALPDHPTARIWQIQSLLERGDVDHARSLLDDVARRGPAHRTLDELGRFAVRVRDGVDTWTGREALNEPFVELVEGRSVAIVGPAPSDTEDGPEIDTHDLVVRINHAGPENLPPAAVAGSRTDISYLSERGTREIAHGWATHSGPDVSFVVTEADWPARLGSPPIRHRSFRDRAKRVRRCFFAGSSPSMIPAVLADVLDFRPARVKLFHTTFYVSRTPHHGTYGGTRTVDPQRLCATLAAHEPGDQVGFVRNLARRDDVDVDPACADVLALAAGELFARFEDLFGAHRWRKG